MKYRGGGHRDSEDLHTLSLPAICSSASSFEWKTKQAPGLLGLVFGWGRASAVFHRTMFEVSFTVLFTPVHPFILSFEFQQWPSLSFPKDHLLPPPSFQHPISFFKGTDSYLPWNCFLISKERMRKKHVVILCGKKQALCKGRETR